MIQNTSLTMKDIEDLRMNEMEELLQGMNENAEKMKEELGEGKAHKQLSDDDALNFLLKNNK